MKDGCNSNKIKIKYILVFIYLNGRVRVAVLADASVVHPKYPGSNLAVDKIFSDSVCIRFEFKFGGH